MKCIEFTAVKSEVTLICIYMDITCIDLFDQIVSMACAKVRLRCSWILDLWVLIYLNKMWVWHVPELDLYLHGYHWYCS